MSYFSFLLLLLCASYPIGSCLDFRQNCELRSTTIEKKKPKIGDRITGGVEAAKAADSLVPGVVRKVLI